ncbi:MAG: phytochelatin synthase family protein [Proteobacteria bacterium]|nr:phytochelatin synthase family protein [Pseudomonadota bacterium]
MQFLLKKLALLLLAILFASSNNAVANSDYLTFQPSQFSQNGEIAIEAWNSAEGIARMEKSQYKGDFYQLASFFQPQINPLYCGVASSVIVLNALRAPKDQIKSQKASEIHEPLTMGGKFIPFKSYSQNNFLNKQTDKVKDRKIINMSNPFAKKDDIDPGFTLQQLADMLSKAYGLEVSANHANQADATTIQEFRELLMDLLNDPERYIIINFHGKSIGLKSGGHISPLAAYDQQSDSVLVLDVAGHKNSWYWAKLEDLYKAMNSKDGNNYRGYLIISDKK